MRRVGVGESTLGESGDVAKLPILAGIRGWWSPLAVGSTEIGGTLHIGFVGLDEEIVFRVQNAEERAVEWTCLRHSGDPSWDGTRVDFAVTVMNQSTELKMSHSGIPSGQVEHGWDRFLATLEEWAVTCTGHPFGPNGLL